MTPDDDAPDDALTRDYRRRSAAEAGRPAAATRAAILAEARSLARHRVRAGKDPRIPWAIAASVSVIGIAVLLWREVAPQISPPIHPMPAVSAALAPAPARVADSPAPATSDNGQPALRPEKAVQTSVPAAMPRITASTLSALPPAPPPAPALALAKAEPAREVTADAVATARLESAAGAVVPPAPDARAGAVALQAVAPLVDAQTPAELVKRYFSAASASLSPPHTLWLLRDAHGVVLRSGTLSERAELAGLAADLQRAYAGRRVGAWVITPLTTERGVPVDLAVAILLD